jgi:histone demethylase JARID1
MSARTKAKDIEKQAKAWLSHEAGALKPRAQDDMKLITRAESAFSIPAVLDLRRTTEIAADLETRCDGVLKNKYAHPDEGDIFDTMNKWSTYAREHLSMLT